MAKTVIAIEPEDDEHGLSVPTPDGFIPPDGVEDGETFQVMADVRMDGDKLILEKLDGKDVGKSEQEEEPEKPEEEEDDTEEDSKPSPMGLWKKFSDSQK